MSGDKLTITSKKMQFLMERQKNIVPGSKLTITLEELQSPVERQNILQLNLQGTYFIKEQSYHGKEKEYLSEEQYG